jgi:integrase
MASIYKRTRDKNRKGAPYLIQFTDHHGKRRTVKGFSDKSETQRLAARIEEDVRKRRLGIGDPEEDDLVRNQNRDLTEHLADFIQSLTSKGRTERYVKLVKGRIAKLLKTSNMKQPSEITVERVEKALIVIQEQDNIGLKTVNHYSLAMKGFVNWMVPSRMPRNPLQKLELRNAETDVRHQRRALRPEEFTCLIETARNSKRTIQHYDGETRSRIYLLSFLTGLRRAEIASLTPESFDLKAIPPTLVVEAATSKRRKKDVLPLHDVLVAMLKEWLADLAPNEPLFPKLANRRTWLMVKLDLKAAGIPYRTKDGVADFHAAGRHTYITELLRNGTSLVEARELARHADVKMTMNYTHIGLEDRAKAVQNLPTDPKWLQMRCISGVPEGHLQSSDNTGCHSDAAGSGDTSPCDVAPSGTHRQKKAPSVTDGAQWRRRESNPRPVIAPRKLLRV